MFKASPIFLCRPLLFVPCWLAASDMLQRLKQQVIMASVTNIYRHKRINRSMPHSIARPELLFFRRQRYQCCPYWYSLWFKLSEGFYIACKHNRNGHQRTFQTLCTAEQHITSVNALHVVKVTFCTPNTISKNWFYRFDEHSVTITADRSEI